MIDFLIYFYSAHSTHLYLYCSHWDLRSRAALLPHRAAFNLHFLATATSSVSDSTLRRLRRRIYIAKTVSCCQKVLATCLYVPQFRSPRYAVVKKGTTLVANTLNLAFSDFFWQNRPSVRTTDSSVGLNNNIRLNTLHRSPLTIRHLITLTMDVFWSLVKNFYQLWFIPLLLSHCSL